MQFQGFNIADEIMLFLSLALFRVESVHVCFSFCGPMCVLCRWTIVLEKVYLFCRK
jgi:hypothetical protein